MRPATSLIAACLAATSFSGFLAAAEGPAAANASTPAPATDWPHLRGPRTDGMVLAPGTFGSGPVALEVAFRVPLGSGYSGVAVAAGRAVTTFASGDADWVAAFDAATGKQIWRHRLGDRTIGLDGAHDGPLSTPLIGGDAVFALAYDGRLVALRMDDGEVMWEKGLEKDFGSKRPFYGFTTTPIQAGNVLVLQAGGADGKSLVGLSLRTGETLWTRGDDRVDYQSPTLMELAGVQQVVAASSERLVGLAPDTGHLLWVFPLEEGARVNSSLPMALSGDRFLVLVSGDARVYAAARTAEGFAIEERYRSNALGGGYPPPVEHEGHLYGFRGNILTCVDAATGERVWRSREPGGDGLILVDGHLVIFASKGNVVVAKASPDGYQEAARLAALDGSSLTWPSFAGGRIYLRNLDELAAVNIVRGAAAAAASASVAPSGAQGAIPTGGSFATWAREVEASSDPQARVKARFGSQTHGPVVEVDRLTLIYRDASASDVGVAGSMTELGTPEPMTRLAGTDLFYRTYQLPAGRRWEYQFQVNFEEWKTDPTNPRTVPPVEGEDLLSELVPVGYKDPAYLEPAEDPRGEQEEFALESKALGYEKKIHVWLPPGYDKGDSRYPLLLVNDAEAWIERGLMVQALDNLVGSSVAPVVVVFVDAHRAWWTEAGGTRTPEFVKMQVEELLPELERRYRLAPGASDRALMGNRYYAFSSAYAALKHPEKFGKVALQSPYIGLGRAEELMEMIAAGNPKSLRFYLDWNTYDERNIDRNWDSARDSRTLNEALHKRGFALTGGEVADSFGWGGWRHRLGQVLTELFPLHSSAS